LESISRASQSEEIAYIIRFWCPWQWEIHQAKFFGYREKVLCDVGRASLASNVAVIANPDFLILEKWGPLRKPCSRSSRVCDGILKPLIVKPQAVPFAFADDKFGVRKISEPLSSMAGRNYTPAFFLLWLEISVTPIDRTNRDNDTRVSANEPPRVQRIITA
jgi:hypothetical protein